MVMIVDARQTHKLINLNTANDLIRHHNDGAVCLATHFIQFEWKVATYRLP